MPYPDQDPSLREGELNEFVHLVQVVLALDVVLSVVSILVQCYDGREIDGRAVEGHDPDSEDLGDVDVED